MCAETNGGLVRASGDLGSGTVSPVSKPGTPVPGGQTGEFPIGGIARTTSTAGSQAARGTASQSTTPGKERPAIAAGISMKKVPSLPNFTSQVIHLMSNGRQLPWFARKITFMDEGMTHAHHVWKVHEDRKGGYVVTSIMFEAEEWV